MLEFKVVLEKGTAQEYLNEHKIDTDISKMMVMNVVEGEKIVGVGALSMDITGAVLEEICADNQQIEYGLGKAMLNALDLGGIKNIYIKNDALKDIAAKLLFKENDKGELFLCLEGYFEGGC